MITAYVAQELSQLEQDQPTELSSLPTREGLLRLTQRGVNQFLNVESARMTIFNTLFDALYQIPAGVNRTQVPNDALRVHGANGAVEAAMVGGVIAIVYPELYRGLLSRQGTDADRAAAAAQEQRMERLRTNPQPVRRSTEAVVDLGDGAPSADEAGQDTRL
ncbi:hypothetical protein WI25_25355 [Burkholderia cepacia]|nr:hypothetical protein WI25_25355 [Burkholderia cepacia]